MPRKAEPKHYRRKVDSPLLMEREAAKYLRVSNLTVSDLRKYGFIRPLKLGARKYPKWELDRFIKKWVDSDKSVDDALEAARREHEQKQEHSDERLIHI